MANARARDGVSLLPAMIDDRIGSIGSTQGVNDNSRPITKNAPSTSQKRPLRSTLSTVALSVHEPPIIAGPAAVETAGPELLAGVESLAAASRRTPPSPPKPTRLTMAELVIGG